jgi:hypothetical protein
MMDESDHTVGALFLTSEFDTVMTAYREFFLCQSLLTFDEPKATTTKFKTTMRRHQDPEVTDWAEIKQKGCIHWNSDSTTNQPNKQNLITLLDALLAILPPTAASRHENC